LTISTKKACYTALMMAVTFIMIMIVRIPIPNGYIHLGDCAVFLSGYILGPVFGPLAAIIGACSADYFSGFAVYIIPTAIAKGSMAWLTAWALQRNIDRKIKIGIMVFASVIMTFVYYLSELIMYGNAYSPLVNIPFNFGQALVGMVVALLLFKPLAKFKLTD